jgi:hypothetical protein
MTPPSVEYREWLRNGVRIFDTEPSLWLAEDRVSDLTMDDLEAAAELLGLNWRKGRPPGYEPSRP